MGLLVSVKSYGYMRSYSKEAPQGMAGRRFLADWVVQGVWCAKRFPSFIYFLAINFIKNKNSIQSTAYLAAAFILSNIVHQQSSSKGAYLSSVSTWIT